VCGRYSLTSPGELVAEVFGLGDFPELEPRYNIAPTQEAAVVRVLSERDARHLDRPGDAGRRTLGLLRWGLIPSWADDPGIGNRIINSRAESAADKPAFRQSFERRRCLVATDGFYEWKPEDGGKQPYRIHRADGRPFALAGLWDRWWQAPRQPVDSFTILTVDAAPGFAHIHDRMPAVLAPEAFDAWLDPNGHDRAALLALLRPHEEALEAYPVSKAVNDPANDLPECTERLLEHPRYGLFTEV
jgi:putative SOS response-associated peptidase YedK